jgi:hypothetical protein
MILSSVGLWTSINWDPSRVPCTWTVCSQTRYSLGSVFASYRDLYSPISNDEVFESWSQLLGKKWEGIYARSRLA